MAKTSLYLPEAVYVADRLLNKTVEELIISYPRSFYNVAIRDYKTRQLVDNPEEYNSCQWREYYYNPMDRILNIYI